MICPLSPQTFAELLPDALSRAKGVAVAVSGGPDSMALLWLLSRWVGDKNIKIHALTVDHGLRAESASEAASVAKTVKKWPNVVPKTLKWKGRKPATRLMEAARAARYELMADYCRAHKIKYLFLAHHMDDQAETFLFRLAKGSGLDGLAGMRGEQTYSPLTRRAQEKNGRGFPLSSGERVRVRGPVLLRPLLSIPKASLVELCGKEKIPFIRDPSNETERFARPRLRKARAALEEEGLTNKRLAVTAARLARARAALEMIAEKEFKNIILKKGAGRIVLDGAAFKSLPPEISLRVLSMAIARLRLDAPYAPRMEKIEDLHADLLKTAPFRKRTLGGVVFERAEMRIVLEVQKHLDY